MKTDDDITKYTWREHIVRSYDVMIVGIAYLIFGLASSFTINYFSAVGSPNDSKTRLAVEIIIEVAITVLFTYFIHLAVAELPLPMIGTKQVQADIVREIRGGIVIAFAMFTLQVKLRQKIELFFDQPAIMV